MNDLLQHLATLGAVGLVTVGLLTMLAVTVRLGALTYRGPQARRRT